MLFKHHVVYDDDDDDGDVYKFIVQFGPLQ